MRYVRFIQDSDAKKKLYRSIIKSDYKRRFVRWILLFLMIVGTVLMRGIDVRWEFVLCLDTLLFLIIIYISMAMRVHSLKKVISKKDESLLLEEGVLIYSNRGKEYSIPLSDIHHIDYDGNIKEIDIVYKNGHCVIYNYFSPSLLDVFLNTSGVWVNLKGVEAFDKKR